MDLPYVIRDPSEVFADGLALHLARPIEAPQLVREEPGSFADWAKKRSARVVILAIRTETDWATLDELVRIGDESALAVVALTPDSSTAAMRRALGKGATSALPHDVSTALIAYACQLAPLGVCVTLAPQNQALASTRLAIEDQTDVPLTDQQVDWLRRLHRNRKESAVTIARSVNYHERTVRRILLKTYRQLGVEGREAAMVQADRRGLLT